MAPAPGRWTTGGTPRASGTLPTMQRRHFLAAPAAAAAALAGCTSPRPLEGGFAGAHLERGHAWRERVTAGHWPAPAVTHRVRVVIAGGGVAGLAAARALRLAGVADIALLELEDTAGGNSRPGQVGGLPCPLGAHYLPVPGDNAREVQDLLEELGLRQRVAGRWQYDERHLCHSPQERLYLGGQWQEGLLPVQDVPDATRAQYRQFAQQVRALGQAAPFTMPALAGWTGRQRTVQVLPALHQALDAVTFDAWLTQQGLTDPYLRWYLDYCCRDDYGAGTARVSAWAGIHYFASRHGFQAPGDALEDEARDGVLTWPEGNGWLTTRLAAPLLRAGQLHTGHSVLRITEERQGVTVDTWNHTAERTERWQARQAVVALPLWAARRVVQPAPGFLVAAAGRVPTAPWVVTNLHLQAPLTDRPGAAPAWDNVLHADANPGGLGYVDAGHQRLDPRPAPTVLSYYQALGDVPHARAALARQPWQHWVQAAIATLSVPHPDLPGRVTRAEVARYGHAMAIPVPGMQVFLHQIGRKSLLHKHQPLLNGEQSRPLPTPATPRLSFAHSDWSGYSVFEEAFTRGHAAGLLAAT